MASHDVYARNLALKRWTKLDVQEGDSSDAVKVELYFKADVIEGVGYRVMVTDMLEIWEETLPVADWLNRWKLLDCNGQIEIKGNGLLEFLNYNLEGAGNPGHTVKWELRWETVSGCKRMALKLIDSTTALRFELKWKILLKLHDDSPGMMYQHVTLPLAAMLSYRNTEAHALMDAISDRDDIVTTLVKDVKEAGLTLQRGTRTKPLLKFDDLQQRTPTDLVPGDLLDTTTAKLYEETSPALLDWSLFTLRGHTPKVPPEPTNSLSRSKSSLKRGMSEAPNLDLDDPNQPGPAQDPTESEAPVVTETTQASEPKKKKKRKREKEL